MTFNEQLAKYLTETWSYQRKQTFYGKSTQDGIPTPESPVPIQSVPSSFDISICGKNIVDISKPSGIHGNINLQFGNDSQTITVISGGHYQRLRYNIPVKPNTQYTLSAKWEFLSGTPRTITCGIGTNQGSTSKGSFTVSGGSLTTNSTNYTTFYIQFWISIEDTSVAGEIIRLYDLMLEENIAKSDYAKYLGQTIPFTVKDTNSALHELRSLPSGTADEVKDGKIVRRIHRVNLKGTQWKLSSVSDPYPYFWGNIPGANPKYSTNDVGNKMCTHFVSNAIWSAANNIGIGMAGSTTPVARIRPDPSIYPATEEGLALFQSFIDANDVFLHYGMKTPISYDLDPEEWKSLESIILRRPDDDSEYNLFTSAVPAPEITYDTFKWQEPVYDRTLQNAKNARMGIQSDFAKGIFSDTVWNRIKGNQIVIKYLISWFYEYIPVELLDLAVKKQDLAGFASWADVESWITDLDLNEMATNDRTLMSQLPTAHANYVPPKNDYVGGLGSGSTSPDWNDLNILERTLQLIKETILSTIANYRICGEPITSANPQQIDII